MKRVIVSGHFNPLHGGHIDMLEAAASLGDYLIVIVNNDRAQLLKKGKIILSEDNRLRLIKALRAPDEALLSIDHDSTVVETLRHIAQKYPEDTLVFANGGDRTSAENVPEVAVCEEYKIALVFGVGGTEKIESSSRINEALGIQNTFFEST